ncbi:MAG TPA: hypothetical protein VNI78_06990 [Vicinamibacterales bacterium]|nr:hypothetical protein [Vicinamibacterales bacterium]
MAQPRIDRLDEPLIVSKRIDVETCERQRDKVREEDDSAGE